MEHVVLPRLQGTKAIAVERLARGANPIINAATAKWFIRYTFYVFVFSLPFEVIDLGVGATIPKLFGVALAGFALLQRRVCYALPPKAFWWFAMYIAVIAVWGSYLFFFPANVQGFTRSFILHLLKLCQLLVLFWISYNLMKQERVINGTLWALAGATTILAVLQILGLTGEVGAQGREAAFSEQNPNSFATVLALGLLSLYGLAYGRVKQDWKGRLLFWLGSGILAIAMVKTGSRGAVLAVVGSLSIFFLRGKSLATKLKFGLIAFAGIVFLVVASYRIEAVRARWEQTIYEGRTAGRDIIYAEAIGMILERPLFGWGPIVHYWELGPRTGDEIKDEHNVYLWILAEVGLVGAIPFFVGLWLCWRAAWRDRHGLQGILPLVMLAFVLAASMKGTLHKNKYFWVVLAYPLASAYVTLPQRSRMAVSSTHRGTGVMRRRYKPVAVARTAQRRSRSF
jgi:O-antigen ligase